MVANLALGNVDAHAKNYALLYRSIGVPQLSPLYDVVPVTDIEPRATAMSMRVNRKILFDEVKRLDIVAEAQLWGLPLEEVEHSLDETLGHLEEGVRAAELVYPEASGRHADHVLRRIDAFAKPRGSR